MGSSAASGTYADIFPADKEKKGAARERTPYNQGAASDGHAGPRGLEPAAKYPLAQTPHRPHPNGKESQQKASRTPEQLWAAVQSGNSKAAVELAELYLQGDGVPQNCAQARVLLMMASEKRNAGAIKRLQELDKTGCPGE
jgi:TPR repeat protein